MSDKPKVTPELVREWIKKDVTAAHYFLGVLLRYPEALKILSDDLYGEIMRKEQGAAIDTDRGAEFKEKANAS